MKRSAKTLNFLYGYVQSAACVISVIVLYVAALQGRRDTNGDVFGQGSLGNVKQMPVRESWPVDLNTDGHAPSTQADGDCQHRSLEDRRRNGESAEVMGIGDGLSLIHI